MADLERQKPDIDEWLHWAQVVIDRLTTCVHTYVKPPHEDIFMRESELQQKNFQTVDLLRRIHALIDESERPSDTVEELEQHGERVIAGLSLLFAETLKHLPQLSTDMQKLMKSPWHSKCSTRLAEELFRGPLGNELEGIGSGHPEHGRLPGVLQTLLERERSEGARTARKTAGEPQRQFNELTRRWNERNNERLRSGGGIN